MRTHVSGIKMYEILCLQCQHLKPTEYNTHPKTINKKQYLSTNNISVNNRHLVIKSSQATQLYITKYFINNSVVMTTYKIILRQKC